MYLTDLDSLSAYPQYVEMFYIHFFAVSLCGAVAVTLLFLFLMFLNAKRKKLIKVATLS